MLSAPVRLARSTMSAAVVGVTFWLGSHDLGAQSLWPDEAYSWEIASKPLAAINANVLTDQIHVPGYYLLLHFWMAAAGASPFAMRFFSVVAGVVAVAALASLVRSLAGFRAALLASLLAAVHPFLLYYLQETRMYSLLLAVVLLELRLLVACLRGSSRRGWLGLALVTAASLYVHYTAVVVLPVMALAPVLLKGWDWRAIGRTILAETAACLLFAPWALLGIGQFNSFAPVTAGNVVPSRVLSDFALALNTGEISFEIRQKVAASAPPWLLVALLGGLAIWGAFRGRARAGRRGFLAALLVLPAMAIIGVALDGRDFAPRYAITSLMGYIPLVALGILALPRMVPKLVCGAAVLAGLLWCDALYFTNPDFQRQDFRDAVRHATDLAVPGDALILLNNAALRPLWHYYAPAELVPRTLPLPLPGDATAFDSAMRAAVGRADRVELFLWDDFGEDPEHRVRAWLETNEHRVTGFGSGETAVYGYFTQEPLAAAAPADTTPLAAEFSGQIALVGYREWGGFDHQGLRVRLVWRRLAPMSKNFRVFAHLVDGHDDNLAIADHRPAFDTLNLSEWRGSPYLIDEYDLSGDWTRGARLEIGLYDPASGERLSPASLRLPLAPE